MTSQADKNINIIDNILVDYISFLWKKRKSIFLKLLLASVLVILYTLTLSDTFRSSAILTSKQDDGVSSSSIASALGQFSGLSGINIGSENASEKDTAIVTLMSYTFFKKIYEDEIFLINLLAVDGFVNNKSTLNPEIYDEEKSKWVGKNTHPQIAFDKYKKAIAISQDPFKPIFTISFTSLSPFAAKEMTSYVLNEIDDYIKTKNIEEAQRAIEYLNTEISKSSIPEIKKALSSMVIQYISKLVIAEKSDQYLFNVIEMPYAPIEKFGPKRSVICVTIFLITLFAEFAYLFLSFMFNFSLSFSFRRGFSIKQHD